VLLGGLEHLPIWTAWVHFTGPDFQTLGSYGSGWTGSTGDGADLGMDVRLRALDSCLHFEQEQSPRGKKRFFWAMLPNLFFYCLFFVVSAFMKGNSYILECGTVSSK
jgi:hypothetical protein